MKPLILKLARVSIVWANDLVRLADDCIFFLETGKTYEQHVREIIAKNTVMAHEAKLQFEESKSKKGTN